MTPSETFVVVDWTVSEEKVEDQVLFVGIEDEAREFVAARDTAAGYKGSVEMMTFAFFVSEVRREGECGM